MMKDELRALKSLAGPLPAFDMEGAPDNPRLLFSLWFRHAVEAGVAEPHAMVLSTVDEKGAPDARIVILKNLDRRGWHFASTDQGPKGRQIALNPQVALTFHWARLGRQVRIRGLARRAEMHERDADFLARPAGARAIALTARQSDTLASAKELEEALELQRDRMRGTPDLVAPHWSLFIVVPQEVEFWQGDTERRHRRLRYRHEAAGWMREKLWP
ncbi:pyridoxal 5'-phosphate synthase [Labrys sp. KNU-23]|uniref:pyridoxine/pyridoxamine 5'-phosphate oxidase n=1 Tax=Labrys sp. KNU-23 TaxID=2789216 RepID=UPI001FEFAF46|nr:pyridoxal 5'-phosphate synthase [Labrys sp. KNU-23]